MRQGGEQSKQGEEGTRGGKREGSRASRERREGGQEGGKQSKQGARGGRGVRRRREAERVSRESRGAEQAGRSDSISPPVTHQYSLVARQWPASTFMPPATAASLRSRGYLGGTHHACHRGREEGL